MRQYDFSVVKPSLRFGSVAAWVFIAGSILAVVPAYVLTAGAGPCIDLGHNSLVFARTSAGSLLPIPVVINCSSAGVLFCAYFSGYLVSGIGTLLLLKARISTATTIVLAALGITFAMLMPFFPNADPYAYALYAYEAFVMHASPYAMHALAAGPPVATLSWLFPANHNPLRIANYGPVSIGLYTVLIGPLGLVSLKAMLWGERVLGAVMLLVLGLLLADTQHTKRAKRQAFVGTVLNPLLLYQSVSFVHGDIVMLVLAAGAYVAYRREKIAVCAVLCVLAFETRLIAVVAIVALLWDLASHRRGKQFAVAVGVIVGTTLVTGALAERLLGGYGHVGGFFYAPANALGTLSTWLIAGNTPPAVIAGFIVGLGLGAAILYFALREGRYNLIPVAVLAAIPVTSSWYAQWLAPSAVVTSNRRYRAALVAFMALAPIFTFLEMARLAGSPLANGIAVFVQWFIPLTVYSVLLLKTPSKLMGSCAEMFGKVSHSELLRYYSFAGLVTALDFALFETFVRFGSSAPVAVAISNAVANTLLFCANRVWTFKAFHRSAWAQARTYVVVVAAAWTITVGVVAVCTAIAHFGPLSSRVIALVVTLPIGFLGHKYLTYGNGIRSALQSLRSLTKPFHSAP